MATALKNAFSTPSAATDTLIYTCPSATTVVISEITICNKSATATTARVYIKSLDTTTYYKYYDITIAGNDTFTRSSGDVMVATDKLYVRATLATLDFSVSLVENT